MRFRAAPAALVATLSALLAPQAWSQTKAGGEFLVNTYTTGNQVYPTVGRDARGNFVVVWDDRSDYVVKGQRFDRAGTRVGAEFNVNTGDYAYFPAMAMGNKGNFVVVWTQYPDGGPQGGIRGQRFDASANRVGAEFAVNTYTTSFQLFPNVAMDGAGNFVVMWWSYQQDGSLYGIFSQRFDAQANRRGAEFQVNSFTTGLQFFGDVSADSAGNFVIAWTSSPGTDGSGLSVNAQRYAADGTAQGANFQINTYTTGNQASVGLAHFADGSFIAGFFSNQFEADTGVVAKRYDAMGNPVGAEFQVNTYTTALQGYPDFAVDARGNFVVSWWSFAGDGNDRSVFARRFRADGTPRGADFLVNTYTTGRQTPHRMASTIATDEVGNFVINWWSPQFGAVAGQDNFAQRFGGLHPNTLAVDTADNSVWEPGETADVRPAWFNANGAAQTVGGVLSNLTGPPGATYTLVDGVASYGTIADNASGVCTDCYSVMVDDPATRPVLHWDASAVETITPDTQGQEKLWRLHIGESFGDVSTTSPFYRFIEILLHHGITSGCGGGNYCPANNTSRAEMSVFVLLAKEGAAFAPPACGMPVFADVPAASPFCRFIEELFRRGVVGGCATNPLRYCPDNPVTREQMAVFVLLTLDPAINPPACTTPVFDDVPANDPFCRWIEELFRRGVVSGCSANPPLYCPDNPVTREQMAVFISVTFGLSLYGP